MVRYPSVQYVHFYTDGSAARKLEPITPLKRNTVRLPAQKKRKRKVIYLDPVALLSMAVAVCLLIMMVAGVTRFYALKEQRAEMAAYVRYLEQENRSLSEKYAEAYDLEEIRNTATALGMIPAEQVGANITEASE